MSDSLFVKAGITKSGLSGWFAVLGKGVVIESPEDVREEFKEWMRAVLSEYENEG